MGQETQKKVEREKTEFVLISIAWLRHWLTHSSDIPNTDAHRLIFEEKVISSGALGGRGGGGGEN